MRTAVSAAAKTWLPRLLVAALGVLLFLSDWKVPAPARAAAFVLVSGGASQIMLHVISRRNSNVACACACFACALMALLHPGRIADFALKATEDPLAAAAAVFAVAVCALIMWLGRIASPAFGARDHRWRVAVHEAGHAMSLALLEDAPACRAFFSGPGMASGECEIDWGGLPPEARRLFLLGGLVSEMFFFGDSEGGWKDMAEFRRECEEAGIDPSPELEAALRELSLLALAGKAEIAEAASAMLEKGFLDEGEIRRMRGRIRRKRLAVAGGS